MRFQSVIVVAFVSVFLTGCVQKASWHADEVARSEKQNFTVGEVQRHIKKGMSGAGVVEALGSPNVISTDENGNEVWIYDKFYTEGVISASNGVTFTLSNVGGAARTSQSTITVIIKFDANKKVRDFAYHKSSF